MRLRPMPSPWSLHADTRGAALVEMAIALPVLLLFLFGIIGFGSWIALAHAVQQGANEGARGAIAGVSQTERATLATDIARASLVNSYGVDAGKVSVIVADDGATLTVDLSYDGSANPLLALPIVAAPSRIITRTSSIRLAGL